MEEEEEGKVEEEKQNEAPPAVEGEPVVFEEEAGAIVEANDQVSIVYTVGCQIS